MASSRSRPSGGAATASYDGQRLAHELRDVHLPALVSSRHAAARVKTINHLNGSSIRPKYIRCTAPDLGQHSLRPPWRSGSAPDQGCICREFRTESNRQTHRPFAAGLNNRIARCQEGCRLPLIIRLLPLRLDPIQRTMTSPARHGHSLAADTMQKRRDLGSPG
jgi:hypothetical protein